jgi:filamentous hemagglutinin family protein
MSQRQVIARSRRRRAQVAAPSVIARTQVPAIGHGGRSALLCGTAFAALVACGLFGFNDRALAQNAALPTGGVVVGGSATITQSGTSQVTINQTTDRGVIDWRSFSIGQGNRVDFIQPGRASVTLNRVTGPDPSVIAGALNANGQVVLVNQAGVMFARGAQVNVESLIASTANVANPQAFMAGGKIAFDQAGANPNARIVNDGAITVRDGGLVALLGPSAANNGVINARLGRVTVGGAETFTVDLNGDGLVNFAVGKPVSQTPRDADGKALALASNTGAINADGGVVAITASAAREVVNGVVNVQGQINARTVTNEGGVIVFGGGETTQVNVGGTIDASGAGATQKGGAVHVTASKVNVESTARINANGGAGGGTVLVGGGKQGAGPIANARNTSVAKGAIITADATHKGNGGTVIIWADNATVFAGTISAKGGAQGGDGGFAEVSGKVYLGFNGLVDLRATDGFQTGTLLLDPSDITISNAADSNIDITGGTITGTANASNIDTATIVAQLALANVIIDAAGGGGAGTGSITVNKDITTASTNTLTFNALTDITLNANVTNTGGAISFISTTGQLAGAGGKVNATTVTFSMGGKVTLNNAGNTISNISGTAGGAIAIASDTSLTILAAGLTSGAATSVSVTTGGATSNLTVSGTVSGTGVTLVAGGNLSGTGAIGGGTGAVSLKASGGSGINLTGTVTGVGLTVQANSGAVTVNNVDNVFNSFTAAAAIGGAVNVVHKGSLSINALDVGANAASFTTNTAGNITLAGQLDSIGGVTLNAAGALAINAKINAAGSDVALTGTSITQTAAGIVTAAGLSVTTTGTADLTQATSAITTLAASVGSLGLLESDGFAIGTVGALDGVTATGTVYLSAGGSITQTKAISAPTVAVVTTAGDINLTSVTNTITTFAASSTGAVGLLETDALSIGAAGAIGTLAALDGVTATNGVSIKAGGTVSQTKAITAGAGGLAVVTTSGDIQLGTVTNATKLVAFSGGGTIAYKTSTDLSVGEVAQIGSNAKVTGATATTSLALTTTGAATTIGQAEAISAPTLTLATGAGGAITLSNSGNLIDTVQGSGTWGTGAHSIVDSAGGLDVGPITSTGNVALTTSGGGLTITGATNVGAKTLALTANGDNAITATAAITAGILTLETGAGGSASIQTAAHDVATVQTAGGGVGTGGIVFEQSRAGGTIVGPTTSAGAVSINDGVGAVTVSGAINVTSANVTLTASAAKLNVNAQISAGSGQVALLAQGDITQAVTNAGITADSLRGESTTKSVSLAPTGLAGTDVNSVNTFAGLATAGSVSFRNSGTFTVGKVNATQGIKAGTSASLQVNAAGGTINQAAGADGAIFAPTLNLTTNGGSVTINSANNDIAALGTVSLGAGTFVFSTARNAGFNVGAVTANGGIDITNTSGDLSTSAAITSDGSISLRSTTGALSVGGTVTSNNGGITLRSSGALNTGPFLVSAPTAVTGDVTLISDTSTVTVGAGGVTVGDTLTLQIGAGLTLNVAGAITATSVALHADIIEISAAINATGTIFLAPVTVGTAVRVGGAAGAGFVIDSSELTFLTSASALTIGQQSTGTTTAGAITLATGNVGDGVVALKTLNLFTTAGVSQTDVLTIGGGTGTLNVTAADTVSLGGFGGGVSVGTVSGSTTSGNFLFIQGGAGALAVGDVTTAGGQIILRNFNNDLALNGNLSSGGGFIAAGANIGASSVLTVNGSINAGAGAVFLFSRDGTTQGGASVITAANLQSQNFSTNNIVLTGQNVVSGNVRLDNAGGAVSFTNTVGYAVGGVSSFNSAVGLFSASGFGIRTAAASTATVTTGGDVTQGAAASDALSVGTLNVTRLGGANPVVTLDNTSNAVTNVGAVTLGAGSFTLVDLSGINIAGAATAGGGYSVTTDGGSLVQNAGATINTSAANGTITLKALNGAFPGASVTLNDNLNAGIGQVTLRGVTSISQPAGAITAGAVDAVTTGFFGSVSLTSATNAFDTITGSSAGLGGFSAVSTRTLTVGAAGITATAGQVSLTSTGATSDLAINGVISASGQIVTLTAGQNITQSAAGGIAAGSLRALATAGSVDLTAGATNNAVTTIAGASNGDFAYTDGGSAALTIGTVTTVGITSSAGDITVKATKAGTTLSATQVVKATGAGGDITLQSAGDLTFTAALTANKRVSLTSTAGSVNQGSAAGVITGAELLANAATNVDLSTGGHSVGATGFAATATTGYVAFLNNTGLEIDSVGGTNGVTAGGAIFIGVSTGDLTQTATGIITAGAGLALFAFNGSITFDQQNLITGNVAVVSSPNANVTIRNKGNLNVGLVGPVTVFGGGSFSADGIAASTAAGKFVSLISDTGEITQSATASSRILGSELRVTTNNKNVTLTNINPGDPPSSSSNSIASIGNSNLGTGKLTVIDGVGDLTLSNPVIADGGVILTTQTTFNLPGSVTVANGGISLTSVTGSIALSSTLSAVNGQVQLDAGGAGTITQTGGSITAKTLIARAPGNVSLIEANNDVGTVAGKSTSGTFTYVDKTAVSIGSLVDTAAVTISGITTTNQDIIVVAGTGGGAGGIAVNQAVNAGTAIVRLQTSTGDISQAVAGLITGNSLLANATAGAVNLAAVANSVVFVAGNAGGSFRLQTNNATGVSSVAADAGALTTSATGITSAGDMAIQTNGNMVIFSPLNAGAGTMRLRTTGAGQVFQLATGTITADALLIDAANTVTLTNSVNNDVNTIAGRTTSGAFRYQDKNGFTVGTVGADGIGLGPVLPIGPLTGVTTAGGDITLAAAGLLTINQAIDAGVGGGTIRLQTGAGNLTQGVNGTITGGSLLAISTGGMVNLTGATNTVTGIAGRAFTSFLFQNSIGYSVSNVVFPSDGIVAAATGITANSGGGGTPFVVDLAVSSGTLAINGPVSSANGMIVYRRTPTGAPGAINVGGGPGNLGNDISSAKLVIVDHTGASPQALYGATPGAAAGGLFTVPTPATGFSPLLVPGDLTGGSSTIGELNGLNTTVYFFATNATILSAGGGGSTFGLLGVYGNSNTVNLTTSVRSVDPNQVRAVTDAFTEPLAGGPLAAFFVRRDGLANATEQFNSCPIGTINCVVFTSPIAAPATSTDDVVIGVGGAPLDDSSVVLVNQGNEDLIIDEGQDDKKKKRDDEEEEKSQ